MSIVSKMLRIAGRSDTGKARAVSVTETGVLKTSPLEEFVNHSKVETALVVKTKQTSYFNTNKNLKTSVIGYNVKPSVKTSFDFVMYWRRQGTTDAANVVSSERYTFDQLEAVFIPIGAIKSPNLTLAIYNKGLADVTFQVEEVYASQGGITI